MIDMLLPPPFYYNDFPFCVIIMHYITIVVFTQNASLCHFSSPFESSSNYTIIDSNSRLLSYHRILILSTYVL